MASNIDRFKGSVSFVKYSNNHLWYKCDDGFMFRVPISETGTASFLAHDKATLFMKWIKRMVAELEEVQANNSKEF